MQHLGEKSECLTFKTIHDGVQKDLLLKKVTKGLDDDDDDDDGDDDGLFLRYG